MAKIKTNKVAGKADANPNANRKVKYSAEQIKNGWIVEKSWDDEKGYHCEKVYHENNPFEGNPMKIS